MELKPPRKKKHTAAYSFHRAPLPVFVETPSGYVVDDSLPTYRGCFNGFSVVVDDATDMKSLYNMGYFGKGSLSRSFPNFGKRKNGKPPVVFETQWKRRKEWIDRLQEAFGFSRVDDIKSENSNEPKHGDSGSRDAADSTEKTSDGVNPLHSPNKESEILVVADLTTDLNPQPRLEHEVVETVVEVSHLTLEEALFLNYALGCLEISNLSDELLSPIECWQAFKSCQKDFVECYVAYHHYRAKGWVVKSGLKYGGQFLLYHSKGPSFYHGSYIVVVVNSGKPESDNHKVDSWEKYSSLNRIAEQANKEVILCHVKWPIGDVDFSSPDVIRFFRVKDALMGRWNPTANLANED